MIKRIILLLVFIHSLTLFAFADTWGQTKPLLGVQVDWSNPITKGLVGCWLFSEGSGDKVYDLSGNGNNGTLTNMAFPSTTVSGWNPGKDGKAVTFDSSNDYANLVSNGSLEFGATEPITIEVQFYCTQSTSWGCFLSKAKLSNYYYYPYISAQAENLGHLWTYFTGQNIIIARDIRNTEHHYILSSDGVNFKVYLDGKCEGTQTVGATTTTMDWLVGTRRNNTNSDLGDRYFKGRIGFIRIWRRHFTPQEIQQLHINPYGMFKRTEISLLKALGEEEIHTQFILISRLMKMKANGI